MDQSVSQHKVASGISRRPMDDRYSRVAIILHWSIAGIILYNLLSGFIVWSLFYDAIRAIRPLYQFILTFHISLGLTALVLTVVRILWRLTHEPPPYPQDMKQWERHASSIAHFFLYAAMLLMPLTGWSIISSNRPSSSAPVAAPASAAPSAPEPAGSPPVATAARPGGGYEYKLWWVFTMPFIKPLREIGAEPGGLGPQRVLHEKLENYHAIGGWILLFLFLLHIAGALKHQWIDRHPTVQRMGLGKRRDGNHGANG